MASADKEAQKVRADRLRAEVKKLIEGKHGKDAVAEEEGKTPSPREFIHRKMRNLKPDKGSTPAENGH